MRRRWPLIAVKFLVFVILFLTIVIAGFGNAVLHLWNWLMPSLFGLHPITFWQAVGLLALSWILFGGWRGFHGPGYGKRWRQRMAERWERMTRLEVFLHSQQQNLDARRYVREEFDLVRSVFRNVDRYRGYLEGYAREGRSIALQTGRPMRRFRRTPCDHRRPSAACRCCRC